MSAPMSIGLDTCDREPDERPPGKENSNSQGARPVRLIITMIKWILTCRLLMKNSLSLTPAVFESGSLSYFNWSIQSKCEYVFDMLAPLGDWTFSHRNKANGSSYLQTESINIQFKYSISNSNNRCN